MQRINADTAHATEGSTKLKFFLLVRMRKKKKKEKKVRSHFVCSSVHLSYALLSQRDSLSILPLHAVGSETLRFLLFSLRHCCGWFPNGPRGSHSVRCHVPSSMLLRQQYGGSSATATRDSSALPAADRRLQSSDTSSATEVIDTTSTRNRR